MRQIHRKPQPKTVEYYTLRRSLVAGMTAEAWRNTPHAGGNYEPDITAFWDTYQRLRETDARWADITANSLLLYVIVQGLIACPVMNGHSYHEFKMATGRRELFENIDVTMPIVLPEGGMVGIKVPGCESKNLRELTDYIRDLRRRLDNTILERPMFGASWNDTMRRVVKQGRVDILVARVVGHSLGSGKMPILMGKARREYLSIPETDRLVMRDVEAGTVMVTNFGSVYRGAYAPPGQVDLIPPQICAIGLGGVVKRPGVVTKSDGSEEIAPRRFIPIQVMFDHRAIDYADTVPFMERLDAIFADPSVMTGWV